MSSRRDLKVVDCMERRISEEGGGYEVRRIERLPDLIVNLPEIERYFEIIENHTTVNPATPNALRFFCHPLGGREVRVNVVETRGYEASRSIVADCFSEWQSVEFLKGNAEEMETWGVAYYNVAKIIVNSIFAGVYIFEKYDARTQQFHVVNSFFMTDWTHTVRGSVTFEELWPRFVEDFKLEPLTRVPAQKKKRAKRVAPIEVLVGADPEFEAVGSEGQVMNAGNFVDGGTGGPIGVDGAGSQVELRPAPGKPHEVVKNLKILFQEFNRKYKVALSVNGDCYPLGGHIHVGVGKPFNPPAGLKSMLDDFVGRPLIELSGDARGDYKQMSACKKQPHGFEYRVPPAACFLNPDITRIVLKMVRNIASAFVNKSRLEYNSPPEKEEYMKVAGLTSREFSRFTDFVSTYNSRSYGGRMATAFWCKDAVKPEEAFVKVDFRDDWQEYIKNTLLLELSKVFKKRKVKVNFRVILYGLKCERGAVSTIPLKCNSPYAVVHLQDNRVPRGMHDGALWIGLPFLIRNRQEYFLDNKSILINSVVSEIERVME